MRREAGTFPQAATLIAALRAALDGSAGRPLRYHVYGGFARACITGDTFTDLDVAAATEEDRRVLRALSRRPIPLRDARGDAVAVRLDVRRRPVPSPAALIAGIELVMARLVFSTTDNCFHMDPDCLDALTTRVLTLRPVRSRVATPARAIGRTLKYAARGARLPLGTLLASLEDYRTTPALVRWGERGLRALLRPRDLVTGGRP